MKTPVLKKLLISFVAVACLFSLYSWPLPRVFNRGIPHTSLTRETPQARYMVMGDHLQLLYHFWLFSDWIQGETPMGYNPYLFNEGDDEATACPVMDYMPFSAVFSLFLFVASRATSWNLTLFLVFWLTHYFLARLVQRHGVSEWGAGWLALTAVGMPYAWASIFGGSPTGFAMVAVPMVIYGLERILRDASWGGSAIASCGLLIAFWTDAHVLLFLMLLVPAWGVLVLCFEERCPRFKFKDWVRRSLAAAPLALVALTAAVLRMKTKAGLGETIVGSERGWREVSVFSPRRAGFVFWRMGGHEHTIYLGVALLVLLVLAVGLGLFGSIRKRLWRRATGWALLFVGFLAILAFALGTNGPRNAWAIRMAREWIPPIAMIRQPAKIFSILTPIVAVLALPVFRWADTGSDKRRWKKIVPVAIALVVLFDMGMQIRPGISLLPNEQKAYAEILRDAESRGNATPQAIALPIWPGDSAWSSLYQYNASLYRIRLLNGYLPVVSQAYVDTVYKPIHRVNSGVFMDDHFRLLQKRGIEYVLLHQNAYPEQSGWFPVGATLRNLLMHPHLHMLKQDGPVWAFRIEAPEGRPFEIRAGVPPGALEGPIGSRLQSELEHEHLGGEAVILDDEYASAGRFVRLMNPGDSVGLGTFDHQWAIEAQMMIRVRGSAEWRFVLHGGAGAPEEPLHVRSVQTDAAAWEWVRLPVLWDEQIPDIRPSFHLERGVLDMDRVAYVSGHPPELAPGESFLIRAPLLYHAGYTDLDSQAVVLRPWNDPSGRILYGPFWPVPEGLYEAALEWATPPPEGVVLGELEIRLGHHSPVKRVRVGPSGTEPLVFSTESFNVPLVFGFYYSRKAPLAIRGIRLTRIQ